MSEIICSIMEGYFYIMFFVTIGIFAWLLAESDEKKRKWESERMASMIPCFDCFSKDGKIDYGDFEPTSYPCCNCSSRKYKKMGNGNEEAKENEHDGE